MTPCLPPPIAAAPAAATPTAAASTTAVRNRLPHCLPPSLAASHGCCHLVRSAARLYLPPWLAAIMWRLACRHRLLMACRYHVAPRVPPSLAAIACCHRWLRPTAAASTIAAPTAKAIACRHRMPHCLPTSLDAVIYSTACTAIISTAICAAAISTAAISAHRHQCPWCTGGAEGGSGGDDSHGRGGGLWRRGE